MTEMPAAGAAVPAHLLVVDDDARVRQMLTRYFEGEGYRVTTAGDGTVMRRTLAIERIDVILLDVVLPGGDDGIDLAREVRRGGSDVPIIMLTGRDDVTDRVVGLEVGADDYISKPFHLREVLARVRNVLRRRPPAAVAPPPDAHGTIAFDGWRLDLDRRQLSAPDGAEVELTTGEFDMLAALARHPRRVMTREALMAETRGRQLEVFDRSIDAQIARLRKKIEPQGGPPRLIKAVRGVGYVFTGKTDSDA
jgi:two-component system phosphate regulon response regulator OmpR